MAPMWPILAIDFFGKIMYGKNGKMARQFMVKMGKMATKSMAIMAKMPKIDGEKGPAKM